MPLTGPVLIGLRARAAPDGQLEMLLSNTGGGRGIYVTSWAAVRLQAMPSLHDLRLIEILHAGSATPLSPDHMRNAASAVAIEGYAGRGAAQAARKAEAAGRRHVLRLRSHLLLELARALDMPGSHSVRNDPWAVYLEEQATWLESAPAAIAAQLGTGRAWAGEAIAGTIAEMACKASGLGLGPGRDCHRLPRILGLMAQSGANSRGLLAASLAARHALAAAALGQARAMFTDMLGLLAAWRREPAAIVEILQRPSWLLDGWDRLCLVQADPAFDRNTRRAPAQLLTHELDGRTALENAASEPGGMECSRMLSGQAASAGTLDRIERHERLRLAKILLDDPEHEPLPAPDAGVARAKP